MNQLSKSAQDMEASTCLLYTSQIRGDGAVPRGDQNAVPHLVHKSAQAPVPFPVNHAEDGGLGRNQSFCAVQAMAVGAAHGGTRLRNLTARGNAKARKGGFWTLLEHTATHACGVSTYRQWFRLLQGGA